MPLTALIQNSNNCHRWSPINLAPAIDCEKLTQRQAEALEAARTSSDGWINRSASLIWRVAPGAIHALVRKGLLKLHQRGDRAQLTPSGRELAERLRKGARS